MKPVLTCTQTDDASVWAKEFCEINPTIDEGTMIGWFANAIECSSDIRRRKVDAQLAERDRAIVLATLEAAKNTFAKGGMCIERAEFNFAAIDPDQILKEMKL